VEGSSLGHSKLLPQNLPAGTKEVYKKSQSY